MDFGLHLEFFALLLSVCQEKKNVHLWPGELDIYIYS